MKPDREAVYNVLVNGLLVAPDVVEEFIKDCELSHMAFWTFPPDDAPQTWNGYDGTRQWPEHRECSPNPLDGARLWDAS